MFVVCSLKKNKLTFPIVVVALVKQLKFLANTENVMSYVKGTLSQDEEIKEVVKLHWFNYIRPVFWAIMMLLMLVTYFINPASEIIFIFLFFLFCLLYDILILYTMEMVVTNKRVVYRKGIISIKTEELKTNKIEAIEIKQSILGRILRYGDICFSGLGISKVDFKGVDNPWAVKSRIESIIGD